ncbi:hepatocyte growth factor-regulated tyrosine kinase substrate isoform X2 [Phymastichus coffea]|uniref:hepatocyte growth factor-regulated tyrosine kinase substrate isoform X2 n=1 Tax=Phymastichus coffea TaxID=108790 RepID=UPI00273B2AEC|nr:hepatocyte growth factor-regulated tyrosine kinase substrate isoform X2 [Phymastichus coffea]
MPLIGLSSNFNKLLEKATSNLMLDPDWPTILSICDLIRQGDVSPKNALAAINKKITSENPHTASFGLLVLESCVKNCGTLIQNEVCTKQYMEQLKEIAKTTQHLEPVRNKILELIQAWAYAFRENPKYRAVHDTMRIMKAENFMFPDLQYSDAMFSADIAPEWVDGDKCHRCRENFTTFLRKHHCRACGQVFCNQCAGKFSVLPKYGIEKEVRVCITCYDQVNKPIVTTTPKDTDLPIEYLTSSLAQQQQVPPRKTDEELREEEELQIALALSQSEAEHKEKEKKRVTSAITSNSTAFAKVNYSPPPSPSPSPKIQEEEEEEYDPDLAKYLDRQYWEQRQSALEEQTSRLNVTSPSAPNISSPMPQKVIAIKQQNGEIDPEMKNFVDALRSQVEIFVNRMKSDSSRGRSIANDSSVQTLFMNITALHSKLLRYIQDQEDKRVYYEGLQDKLTQIKDARCALDALREEHRLTLLQEKQEADRKKQLQMAQKLEIMRKEKREYLQYQRELALSRIQEQEREMQMRQEQQKQQYKMSGYSSVDFMGPSTQGSPVRQVQYSNSEAIYSSLPAANPATAYAYPPATGTYQVPANYMIQHPHQPQSIDPAAIPESKPPAEESQNKQNHESLGRVTVSGPGLVSKIQIPVMGGPPSQSPLQGLPTTTYIPTTGQPVTHIPTNGMAVTGHMMPPAPGQIPPQMMPSSQQMIQAQQRQQMMQAALARQMAMAGQIPGQPPHSIGANMPMPGHGPIVMPSSNGPMQAPIQQMQGSPQQVVSPQPQIPSQQQQMPGPPQQLPNQSQQIPGIAGAHMAAMSGVRIPLTQQAQMYHQQMQQHQQQIAQQQPSQQPPQQPQMQQLPVQQQLPQQQQEPEPQPQEPMSTLKQEEERKSPEVAELITFD